jgi:hypothetical protein
MAAKAAEAMTIMTKTTQRVLVPASPTNCFTTSSPGVTVGMGRTDDGVAVGRRAAELVFFRMSTGSTIMLTVDSVKCNGSIVKCSSCGSDEGEVFKEISGGGGAGSYLRTHVSWLELQALERAWVGKSRTSLPDACFDDWMEAALAAALASKPLAAERHLQVWNRTTDQHPDAGRADKLFFSPVHVDDGVRRRRASNTTRGERGNVIDGG